MTKSPDAKPRSPLQTRLKARAADALCHPLVGRAIRAVFRGRVPSLRFPGWRLALDAPGVTPRTAAEIFWGVYESAELRFVQHHLRPDLDVVEVGSSIGAVSSAIARRQQPNRRLVCVEANPQLLDLLRRNIAANAPGHRVDIVQRAISYDGPMVRFGLGASNVSGRLESAQPGTEPMEVPATTLSEILREHGLKRYALVADIEGGEAAIIEKDEAAFRSCDQILIELHATRLDGRDVGIEDLVRNIEARGLSLTARHGPVCVFERPLA